MIGPPNSARVFREEERAMLPTNDPIKRRRACACCRLVSRKPVTTGSPLKKKEGRGSLFIT